MRGNLSEKVILKLVRRYTEERNLFNASQFEFGAYDGTKSQRMGLTDYVTLK
jgi:hypothetical protein